MNLSTVNCMSHGRTGVNAANTTAKMMDRINLRLYGFVNSKTLFKSEKSKKRFFAVVVLNR